LNVRKRRNSPALVNLEVGSRATSLEWIGEIMKIGCHKVNGVMGRIASLVISRE
jgi:hypothetical protein